MKALKKDILSENFCLEGSEETNLKEDLQKMNDSTVIMEIDSSELILYSIIKREGNNFLVAKFIPDEVNNEILFPVKREEKYPRKKENYGNMSIDSLKNMGFTSELIEDSYESGFFFQIPDKHITLVPSKMFLSVLCNQMGCGKLQIGTNIFRDLYLCSLLQDNGIFQIIYRTDDGYIGRLLGAASSKFSITPEGTVHSLWNELEKQDKFRLFFYRITHTKTIINFRKEASEIIGDYEFYFGCRFSFSDIGRGSYTLESTLIYKEVLLPLEDRIERKHIGEFKVKEFVENYFEKNVIHKVLQNLNRASKKAVTSVRKTVIAFISSSEFTKANGAKATKKLIQDEDFFLSIPDYAGTEFEAIYWTGAIADYYLHQKTDIQYEVICKCIGKIWREGLEKYTR